MLQCSFRIPAIRASRSISKEGMTAPQILLFTRRKGPKWFQNRNYLLTRSFLLATVLCRKRNPMQRCSESGDGRP